MGGGVKQMQVQPDPDRMRLHQITYEELRDAAAEAVKNTTGGFLTERAQEIMVRNLKSGEQNRRPIADLLTGTDGGRTYTLAVLETGLEGVRRAKS